MAQLTLVEVEVVVFIAQPCLVVQVVEELVMVVMDHKQAGQVALTQEAAEEAVVGTVVVAVQVVQAL